MRMAAVDAKTELLRARLLAAIFAGLAGIFAAGRAGLAFGGAALFAGITGRECGTGTEGGNGQKGQNGFHNR
jgi:hypothetical protein